jgi:hypothetical protein
MDYSGKSMDVPGNQIRHENHWTQWRFLAGNIIELNMAGIFQPCLITRGWGRGHGDIMGSGSLECMGM